MDTRKEATDEQQQTASQQDAGAGHNHNPFGDKQPAESETTQREDDLEKEQQFKEALTERD